MTRNVIWANQQTEFLCIAGYAHMHCLRLHAFSHLSIGSHFKLPVNTLIMLHFRDKMNSMDSLMARGSLKVIKLTQSRCNYVQLHNKVRSQAF